MRPVVAGIVCLAVTTLIVIVAPSAALVGMASLTAALVLLLPVVMQASFGLLALMRRRMKSAVPALALMELRSPAIHARSMAIASTGAVAVFGSVAIQGAHGDLQHGLDNATRDVAAHVWVSPPGPANMLSTVSFRDTHRKVLERVPGVAAVRVVRGTFLDFDERRVWVIGEPRDAARPVPPSQVLEGDVSTATERVRRGGWAVVSEAIAKDHGLHVGDSFTLPSPHPTRFRVAALSTNNGWPPGANVVNAGDYARAWGSTDPSAYDVAFAPGNSPVAGARRIEHALGADSGLAVETALAREQRQKAASRDGLTRLTQIASLVLIAAVLAMAAATGGMIWQRRVQLAGLKVDGFTQGELWRVLLLETSLLLGVGCLVGAVVGLYGQLLLSRALSTVTGFPVVYSAGFGIAVACFALVTTVAVAIVAVPGYFAARVRPAVSFGE
jgi:putative ABC transport system permease protein